MLPFTQACSAGAPISLALDDEEGREIGRRELIEPFLVVGRHEASDWRLDHPAISRRHAYLQIIDGRLAFFDLASRTGVHARGKPRRWGWVEVGDAIGLGPFRLRNLGIETDRPIVLPALREPASLSILEFIDAEPGPIRWPLQMPMALVGRAASCNLRLPEDEVSQFHCSLVQTPGGLWVVDLLSRTGTSVASRTIRTARLDDGAIFQVGRRQIRVHVVAPGSERARSLAESTPGRSLSLPLQPDRTPAPLGVGEPGPGPDWAVLLPILERIAESQRLASAQCHQALQISERILGLLGETAGSAPGPELDRLRAEADRLRREIAQSDGGEAPGRQPRVIGADGIKGSPGFTDPSLHHLIQERLGTIHGEDGFWGRFFRRG